MDSGMMDSGKVIRAPSLRRGKTDERLCDRIKLKKVLGLTVCSNAALDVSPTNGLLAYPAGCTVVLFNAKKLHQTHLLNSSKKTITAVAYSHCGRYIATGECGINPAIKVWELDNNHNQNGGGGNGSGSGGIGGNDINDSSNSNSSGGTIISEFLGHKYAVTCVAFSPTGKYLVSVGSQHDMIVNVFDWKLNLKIASNKVSAKVSAVSFSEDGNYFVTVGNRHVKFWYLEGNRKYKEPIPLMGRSAILGELRNNDFCAVSCGKGDSIESTYAITRVGHLVEFNSRRLLDKWVACRTTSANCICVTNNYILVGCSEAIIRIFNSHTLEYITTLPRTHYLGVDVAQGIHINHIMNVPQNAKYPDTVAMVYDKIRSKVTCVYNDHSLYIWDLRDIKRVGKSHSFLYHSACIWGVETVPSSNLTDINTMTKLNSIPTLPDDSFLTCSSDDTIRVWGLDGCQNNEVYRKNIYSKELLKIIYIDEDLNFIKDVDNPILTTEKNSTYDGRNGVRCIKISPDRIHLASGDRSGNIRVYNLNSLKLITMIEAHDSEVLCLEYTNDKIQRKLLASASRDRLIHVFDVNQSYKILQTLDDHSSSITSIKFLGSGLNFQMISCGADKSIVFRTFQNNVFTRGTNCSGKTTLYDMEIDSNSKHILTACQDRNIRVYGTQNGKHTKTFKGSHSDEGSLIKLSLDPSGIYIATSCTDKTLSVYDYYSNECMARMYGHSELVTGLKFTNDCRHLISASGDGCIFVWQVPHDMVVTMQARLSQQRIRSGQVPIPRPISNSIAFDATFVQHHQKFESEKIETLSSSNLFTSEIPLTAGYKFAEVGQLPQWAKRKNSESENVYSAQQQQQQQQQSQSQTQSNLIRSNSGNLSGQNQTSTTAALPVPKARGRWAQRGQVDTDALDLKNSSDTAPSTPHANPLPTFNFAINNSSIQTSDYNSASSKDICYHQAYLSEDSSLDSGVENRRETERRLTEQKRKSQILRFEANNDNDGDVEDISDGERTSSDHGMMFYPTAVPGTPTDFKVNAMNEEELRKSVRKKHFEKVGLSLNPHSAASTGTGTSDTEDEGSTPSGENAERSLASTLGGSSENIPQQSSSSFLQSALDGPGNLTDRGGRSRRSISAKHNNQNSQNNSSLTYSKSYTNSKKEELMKVINEAKQKLEDVGYRSNLRGSLSVSDLSHSNPLDSSSRINRPIRTGDFINASTKNNNNNPMCSYFNCAAPKSVLTQNCNIIRQIQKNYPPYPHEIGSSYCSSENYNNLPSFTTNESSSSYHNNSKIFSTSKHSRPCTLDLQSVTTTTNFYGVGGGYEQQSQQSTSLKTPTHNRKEHQQQQNKNLLKNYKSCPVSPVHEELEWGNLVCESKTCYNFIDSNESQKQDYQHQQPHQSNKRHKSMYSSDAKLILDMIHSDTEKMIAEITEKYGDLDTYETEKCISDDYDTKTPTNSTEFDNFKDRIMTTKRNHNHHHHHRINEMMNDEEKDNFSSDSLEDCSLSLDFDKYSNRNMKNRKSVCKKHSQNDTRKNKNNNVPKDNNNRTLPTRSVSDYFIYPEFYSRCPSRNVSLSDILTDCENEEQQMTNNNPFLRSDRHSSASFFLVQYSERKSQDSILSDDLSNTSLYNSMDSILSDESDCKSAPLEVLFNRARRDTRQFNYDSNQERYGELTSKSYGSSPNNASSFDFYMHNRNNYSYQEDIKFYPTECGVKMYYETSNDYYYNMMRPKSPRISTSSTAVTTTTLKTAGIPTSNTFPIATTKYCTAQEFNEDIPTLMHKNEEYKSAINKSLRKEFADQRYLNNSNPLYIEVDNERQIENSNDDSLQIEDKIQTSSSSGFSIRKSCSFDIDMNEGRKISHYVPTRFEKNLRKFEKDQKHSSHSTKRGSASNTLEMDYVPHKPPVASRRSSSMRSRSRNRSKSKINTADQIDISHPPPVERPSSEVRDFVNPNTSMTSSLKRNKSEEKIFEMFISEKGSSENMDSLELYTKPDLFKENSIDSLDDIGGGNISVGGYKKNRNSSSITSLTEINRISPSPSQSVTVASTAAAAVPSPPPPPSSSITIDNKFVQFEDIEKKINIINKLVKMEEMKLEQERQQRENRMKPLINGNPNQKGYVKNLTMNFDKLVKNIEEEIEFERNRQQLTTNKVKRNYSLPDVLEGAKLKNFEYQKDKENFSSSNDDEGDCDYADTDGIKMKQIKSNYNRRRNEGGNPKSFMSVNIDDSSIRRACSLSDLCMGKGHNNNNNNTNLSSPQKLISSSSSAAVTSAAATSNRPNSFVSRSSSKRNSVFNHKSNSNMGSRSISVGVLNQESDSETDTLESSRDIGSHVYVSSPNRTSYPMNASSSRQHTKSNSGSSSRRKTLSVSSSNVNLSITGHDDSSSEETLAPTSNTHLIKPIVPPRPRNLLADHKKSSSSTTIIQQQTNGGQLLLTTNTSAPSVSSTSSSSSTLVGTTKMLKGTNSLDTDVGVGGVGSSCSGDGVDSTSQLCTNIINMLNTTTNAVLQLHSRLKYNEEGGTENGGGGSSGSGSGSGGTKNNYLLLKELENAVIMTQNVLTRITNNKNDSNSYSQLTPDNNNTNTITTTTSTTTSSGLENSDYLFMMNKCTDILDRVRNNNNNNNNNKSDHHQQHSQHSQQHHHHHHHQHSHQDISSSRDN